MADESEVTYTKPTALVALEEQSNAKPPAGAITHQPGQQVIDNGGYTGVDPVYQNFANDTEAPYTADEGPDKAGEDSINSALDRVQADGKTDVEFDAAPRKTEVPAPTEAQSESYKSVAGVVVEETKTTTTVPVAEAKEPVSNPEEGETKSEEGIASEGTSGEEGKAAEGAKKQGRPSGSSDK